ncbi:multidrug effflux MFS transporter [Colwellia sp. RE-S-Sl-9]
MSLEKSSPKQILSDKWLAVLLALLVGITPFSLDSYLPAIPAMAESLSVNVHVIEQTLGIFLLGTAFGQLFGGPISDFKGRKFVSTIGLVVFLFSSLAIYYSTNIQQVMWLRFIQAIGAGMALVVVGAIVRDTYDGAKAAGLFALIGLIMMAAPVLAPIVGAVLHNFYGWRSIFLFLTVFGGVLLILNTLMFKETNQQTSKFTLNTLKKISQQYIVVFKNKEALGFLFFGALSFSSMFAFLTESPFVYMTLYEVEPEIYPILFGANIIVMAIFNRITAQKLKTTQPVKILKVGVCIQFIANLSLFIAAFLFNTPLPVVVCLVMFSVGSQGLIVANIMSCYMDHFPTGSGTANAVLGTSQFLFASIVGWITTLLHNGTLMPMATMMFASTVVGIILLVSFSKVK